MNSIVITRTDTRFIPNNRRLITKPYLPGEQLFPDGRSRVRDVVDRVLGLSDDEVASTLDDLFKRFADRHSDLTSTMEKTFESLRDRVDAPDQLSAERRLLIGGFFTHEYSIEGAALSNPSMVPAPDQSGLEPGDQRFIMSMRAVGEGHISSIEFRTGVINSRAEITVEPVGITGHTGELHAPNYDRHHFQVRLEELGILNDITSSLLNNLTDPFTLEQLETALREIDWEDDPLQVAVPTAKTIQWLAYSNYTTIFSPDSHISDRVLFPAGPAEIHGMEDARFVRFVHDNGTVMYYATYTAYDGLSILPQIIETTDFVSFRIATLHGNAIRNKGMAIFPRMIDGRYAALSRFDGENNHLMMSDSHRVWENAERIQVPKRPWELMQIGNCGSPLETEAGWLVITHGVGAMRQYSIGAILLDTNDPYRVIGHLKEPLLRPTEDERDGYVPNVVYSCGSMIHDNNLVLPYGFSDLGAHIALVNLDDLLSELTAR
ncbi:MAG: glycoside hydrolase family 130 protein [Acidimicrobiia bacterium]|nr:glycoside hydrolase family 130 protein [Acidimicrobiia bacterium]